MYEINVYICSAYDSTSEVNRKEILVHSTFWLTFDPGKLRSILLDILDHFQIDDEYIISRVEVKFCEGF